MEEHWLNKHAYLPVGVAAGLSLPYRPTWVMALDELARQLNIPTDGLLEYGYRLLEEMVRVLQLILEEGRPEILETRGLTVAAESIRGLGLDERVWAAQEMGLASKIRVEASTFAGLDAVTMAAFAKALEPHCRRLLVAWEKRNVFGQSELGVVRPRR